MTVCTAAGRASAPVARMSMPSDLESRIGGLSGLEGEASLDTRAPLLALLDGGQVTAQRAHPFPHAAQAQGAELQPVGLADADPIVIHTQGNAVAERPIRNSGMARPRVLDHVVQRFLGDAEQACVQ